MKHFAQIMGILNLTPDSFSDGGDFNSPQKALKQLKKLKNAHIIDIGGESTGPNSKKVTAKEELKRISSILQLIRPKTEQKISIDTYKASVAKHCLNQGADIINDITALRGDSKMAKLIAQHGCPVIIMYSKDSSARTTIKAKKYKNIIKTITEFFEKRIAYAEKQGIKRSQIIIDPGMGHYISSIPKYSYEIISRLPELKAYFKLPILVGLSRKSFLASSKDQAPKDRDHESALFSALASIAGADIIRTHNTQLTQSTCQQ